MNALAFELPPALEAAEPPEARGFRRDQVRLMVARRSRPEIMHRRFDHLPDLLDPGDLLVVNVSATLPAAIGALREDGSKIRVHVASRAPRLPERWRVVELRSSDGANPIRGRAGETVELVSGHRLELVAPYASGARLMLSRFGERLSTSVEELLARFGAPIRYGYVARRWPLSDYQTVFAQAPGSAEMPSAARPFTAELVLALSKQGVATTPITLHTSVSSPERHEAPVPEYFEVPDDTAGLVEATRERGSRVIAVGTTVARALESAAGADGAVRARKGWTNLVITPQRGVRTIDGLITGWHEPEASHLQLLEAILPRPLLERCYAEALHCRYLWHEFGDSHLILP